MRRNNKSIYIVLIVVLLIGVTIGYAVINTTLNINGKSSISKNTWDVYFDNIVVKANSVEAVKIPTITDKTTVDFEVALNLPGDFYEFTIDVVNDGTIDAMIDGVTKTPTLTTAQAKYLNYIVEYQNGEPINNKQLVAKNSFVRLKVKLEFRKDLVASDLPTTSETLDLSFTVNYVQNDGSGNITIDNNGKLIKVVSGDGSQVGDEICIGQECFYVISSDEDSVTMLAKYNLYVGKGVTAIDADTGEATMHAIENPTGIQDFRAKGLEVDADFNLINFPWIGTTAFSSTWYWIDSNHNLKSEYGTSYPAYVYDSNSTLYNYVESYRTYLESQGVEIEEARLIKMEELEALGCSRVDSSCLEAPSWVYATTYWTGAAHGPLVMWNVMSFGDFSSYDNFNGDTNGVRPVFVISKSLF